MISNIQSKFFPHSFKSYRAVRAFVSDGRDPVKAGRPYLSQYRLFLVDDEVHAYIEKDRLAVFRPDNTVELVLTKDGMRRNCVSLSGHIHKLIPVSFNRIGIGRYKLLTADDVEKAERNGYPIRSKWHRAALAKIERQEYFQHLRLDLSTGKIINPKDMKPKVNPEKRQQWLAGLKQARLHLRSMARVGALEHYKTGALGVFMGQERMTCIANCIMQGRLDETAVTYVAQAMPSWKVSRYATMGDAVLHMFESVVKSNNREMRIYAGVLDITP